eukprot:2364678-Rhodomonas_salina.3
MCYSYNTDVIYGATLPVSDHAVACPVLTRGCSRAVPRGALLVAKCSAVACTHSTPLHSLREGKKRKTEAEQQGEPEPGHVADDENCVCACVSASLSRARARSRHALSSSGTVPGTTPQVTSATCLRKRYEMAAADAA